MKTEALNFFEAPLGSVRGLTMIMGPEYRKRYSQVGAFRKHEYDLDICTLYRQMDDLNTRYTDFAGKPYGEYVKQIRDSVLLDLERLKLDADFYIDHFYLVLQPNDSAYTTYLPLFFSLNDYLKLIPLLEYHMQEFALSDTEKRGEEGFLNLVEFQVCRFLRSNRFPEDWFAKHDKILNWVYSKKAQLENEKQLREMMQLLVDAVNKTAKAPVPAGLFQKAGQMKKSAEIKVRVIEDKVEVLFDDLKAYFGAESHEALKRILRGEGQPYERVIFEGQGNQLIDAFRVYCDDKNMFGDKRAVARFIVQHFMTFTKGDTSPQLIGANVENVIYGQGLPSKKSRISLSGLKYKQSQYYLKKSAQTAP